MKKLIVLIAIAAVLVGSVLFFRIGNVGTTALWNLSGEGKWLLPLIAVSALIDSINPCAFSILLLTIAFLLSIGRIRTSILKVGGAYILGLFFIYLLIGLGLTGVLHLFNTPHFMAKLGAILLLILGTINLLGVVFPTFPIRLKIPDGAHRAMARLMDKASLPTAFALGVLVGLCEFPCTGGPYLMVTGLLHDRMTYLSGVGYLILYNLIFVLPLVIMLAIASNKNLLEKVQAWQQTKKKAMRLWSGVAMVVLGIIILSL